MCSSTSTIFNKYIKSTASNLHFVAPQVIRPDLDVSAVVAVEPAGMAGGGQQAARSVRAERGGGRVGTGAVLDNADSHEAA